MSHPAADSTTIALVPGVRRSRVSLALGLLVGVALSGPAAARDTDRNQPMDIKAGHQVGSLDGNSVNVLSQGVVITQGTLDIQAARADIHQSNGEVVRAVLTGSQAVLKQQMQDGSWMTAKADRIDYDMSTDVIVLTGNYTVTTARGSTSGQKMTYDLKTSRVESGGEGNGPVILRILPKSGPAKASTTEPKPATQGKP